MLEITTTTSEAADGHEFSVVYCEPNDKPKGLVIIVQEIFGLTEHTCSLTKKFAKQGYLALTPAIFDRIKKNKVFEYNKAGAHQGKQHVAQLDMQKVLIDIQSVINTFGQNFKVAVVGYCWGGTVAYLAASQLNLDCAISFYGTKIRHNLEYKPNCPFLFHFGETDQLVPLEAVEQIRKVNSDSPLYIYPNAGHAFCCEPRPTYHPESATLAFERSQKFLNQVIGK